jgi:PEGA domain
MHVRALTIATLVCGLLSFPALADKLRITTVPPGATVQINGVLVGITPYEQSIPGGYLHKTKTALGSRLGYPMVARLTLEGYAAKEIQLTEGPMSWVSTLKGHNHGSYWLLKTDHFQVELQSASKTFTGSVESVSGSSALVLGPRLELSLEELVSRTKPAVVFLKSLTKSGTGFLLLKPVSSPQMHIWRAARKLC